MAVQKKKKKKRRRRKGRYRNNFLIASLKAYEWPCYRLNGELRRGSVDSNNTVQRHHFSYPVAFPNKKKRTTQLCRSFPTRSPVARVFTASHKSATKFRCLRSFAPLYFYIVETTLYDCRSNLFPRSVCLLARDGIKSNACLKSSFLGFRTLYRVGRNSWHMQGVILRQKIRKLLV